MPMHPGHRPWGETLREDREAIVLADRLGFYDAFIGEHLTDKYENVTNSMIFQAALVSDTTQIKLGTGTTNLSQNHPVLVAANAAMLDHLSGGRFILGISAGALPSDAEVLGLLGQDLNEIFADAIDVILRLWEDEAPYDIGKDGDRFRVRSEKAYWPELGLGEIKKPLQRPRPEIVGTVVAPFSAGAVAMGERDFHPLSANFLLAKWLGSHWQKYSSGAANAGRQPDLSEWRVARTVFVADDGKTSREYGRDASNSPFRFYYRQMIEKMRRSGRLGLFKSYREQPDDEVTLDGVLDELVICGTPEQVAEEIVALHAQTGGFGELVYGGMDWVDPVLGRRSMELMAEEVMPMVNAEIATTTN
jgi:alkanesulfonate monooxygenase SsuD/methylene tetrahydromethanopterin reductase-like flavin-dependent oxidoreductase (luciferase family)